MGNIATILSLCEVTNRIILQLQQVSLDSYIYILCYHDNHFMLLGVYYLHITPNHVSYYMYYLRPNFPKGTPFPQNNFDQTTYL